MVIRQHRLTVTPRIDGYKTMSRLQSREHTFELDFEWPFPWPKL